MSGYIDDGGKKVVLGDRLGGGGEGAVYAVKGRANSVAKLYEPHKLTSDLAEKLRVMVANPPIDATRNTIGHVSIAWPDSTLQENGQFVGYLMPRISEAVDILSAFNPKIRQAHFEKFHWGHAIGAATNLCLAIAAVHQAGYVIGDVNEGNARVNDKMLITLIDTDSFQVRDPKTRHLYPCLVQKDDYMPPEVLEAKGGLRERTAEQDRFALAILLFKLLMDGMHPFNIVPAPGDPDNNTLGANIIRGIFPYEPNSPRRPPPIALPFDILPQELQALFLQCFVDGLRQPSLRPDALTWAKALEQAEKTLKKCRKDHRYAGHLDKCPWCAREEAISQSVGSVPVQKRHSSAGLRSPSKSQPGVTPSISPPPAAGYQPPETKGICWGGFLLTWFWCFFNRVWLPGLVALASWLGTLYFLGARVTGGALPDSMPGAALMAVPAVYALSALFLLLRGRRLAWNARTWPSPSAFRSSNRRWAALGVLAWLTFFAGRYLMGYNTNALLAAVYTLAELNDPTEAGNAGGSMAEETPSAAGDADVLQEAVNTGDSSGAAPPTEGERPRVRVLLNAANVRGGPGEAYAVIGTATRDEIFSVIATDLSRGWYNVVLGDGERGWIGSQVVEELDSLRDVPVAATIPAPP